VSALTQAQVDQYRFAYDLVHERAEHVLHQYGSIKGDDLVWSVEFSHIEGDTVFYTGTERYNGYGDERSVTIELPIRSLTDDSYLTELREEVEAEEKAEERRKKRKAADQKRARKKKDEAELARLKELYE
jgi:hypothetical protein